MKQRSILRTMIGGLAGLALVAPMAGMAAAAPAAAGAAQHSRAGGHGGSWPDRIELPNGFQPEGITIGPGPVAYFGSRVDGDIYAASLKTGRGRVISQGPGAGFPAVGLKSDQRGLLYVSGGVAGTARVVSTRTGDTLATYTLATGNTFVNDVVLANRAAWFTDSRNARLYAVPLAKHGRPAPASAVRTVPLRGQWEQSPAADDVDANGIALTPNRRNLLVVNSASGKLYRVDPATGYATQVDLGSTRLVNGDGLLVRGRTLYAVQNRLNKVAVVRLNSAGTAGRLVDELTSTDFDVPTTIAAYRGSLYLPNARFTTPPTATTPYWVTRISR